MSNEKMMPVREATRTRGFEAAKGYLQLPVDGVMVATDQLHVRLPKRSTTHSAGYDFEAAEDVTIEPVWYQLANAKHILSFFTSRARIVPPEKEEQAQKLLTPTLVPTGIKAYMPKEEALVLLNRSSGPIKRFLLLSNGVGLIDADYYGNADNDGHIMFQFINFGLCPVHIKKGDKIGQGVFIPFKLADGDEATGIRESGFGSTGK